MRVLCALAVLVVLTAVAKAGGAQTADLACDQEPGNRFIWVERAFCDLEPNGPDKAHGLVIWNHGISGTLQSYKAPAPPVFRLLHARGWDVIMVKRHNQAESSPGLVNRAIERTLREAKERRRAGYRKVVLAGQSFGGYLTLEALDEAPDVFAAVAFAPGVRAMGATGRLDPGLTDLQLQRAKVERIAVVFPKDDSVFANMVRGESADRILARRKRPYLVLDETSGLTGHGGAVGGRFAIQFGPCLAEFLAAAELPGARFACPPPGNPWPIVRDLLMPALSSQPTIARDSAALPAGLGPLAGTWYSLIDESVVLFGLLPAQGGDRLQALYRSSTFSRPGLVYDAEVRDGRVHVTLPAKDRIAVSAEPDGVFLAWTSSDGSRTLRTKLTRASDE